MGWFSHDTEDDAIKQISKINVEMRAISSLIHLNYNMIDGRNRDKIRSHVNTLISLANKYEKIKSNLSQMDQMLLMGATVDVWNGERVGIYTWEVYFSNTMKQLAIDINY